MALTIFSKDQAIKSISLVLDKELQEIKKELARKFILEFNDELTKLVTKVGVRMEARDNVLENKKDVIIVIDREGN